MDRCPDDGSPLVSRVERDLVGAVVDGRYRVDGRIAQGGMGVLCRAEQLLVGRKVALKVLSGDVLEKDTAIRRFRQEARAIAALKSSHTVTLHDFGVTGDGLLYYTMDLLEGRPLSELVAADGPLSCRKAADIVLQVCDSLEEAHANEILHRDIKSENLFLSRDGGGHHVTVLDFGIAKTMGPAAATSITQLGRVCGTPEYMSPEQCMGQPLGPASDLYSLSVVLYEMLAGRVPFLAATPFEIMQKHVDEPLLAVEERNPKALLPEGMRAFLERALDKDPQQRFGSVSVYRAALMSALTSGR